MVLYSIAVKARCKIKEFNCTSPGVHCRNCGRCRVKFRELDRRPGDLRLPVVPGAAAVDLGTTSVAGALLVSPPKYASLLNMQFQYGDNLIDRIAAVQSDFNRLGELRDLALKTIKSLLENIAPSGDFEHIWLAGNTTMCHILCGLDPTALGQYPFTPETLKFPDFEAFGAKVHVLPAISGFLGGDIAAGLTATGFADAPPGSLYIDLGTNAEMIFKSPDGSFCGCSAAAGPAFERGMGDLWGAELCRMLADARRTGVLDAQGRLSSPENHLPVSEAAVAELIQAKAAIQSGWQSLLDFAGCAQGGVRRLYLAGGLGEHLNFADGVALGLLPDLPGSAVVQCRNAALTGAAMAAAQPDFALRAAAWSDRITTVNLNELPDFSRRFCAAMQL